MDTLFAWGIGVVLALQAFSTPALDGVFLAITQLGSELFFLLLVPLIYWCLDKRFGSRLAFLFLLSAFVNVWLKALFNTPRPYEYDSRVKLIGPPEPSPAFPSGHAQSSTTTWAALGRRAQRGWVWALGIAIIALVSLSRMYLGVHFPHDVAGGIVIGALIVAIFARVEPGVSSWLATLPFGAQIALSVAVPLALLPIFVDRDSVAAAAVLSGTGIGYALQRRSANFSAGGPIGQRALRFVLGTIGTLAIYLGLRVAFEAITHEEGSALWYALRYVRYGLVGVWAIGLWPTIVVRTGLAAKES
jgi:membrane-associated phospholipid phosphatase